MSVFSEGIDFFPLGILEEISIMTWVEYEQLLLTKHLRLLFFCN